MQRENNIIKGEMPKGNARKLWTDSNCRILLMLIHKKDFRCMECGIQL